MEPIPVHYATHDTRLTHGHRKVRLAEDFEMFHLTPDFEISWGAFYWGVVCSAWSRRKFCYRKNSACPIDPDRLKYCVWRMISKHCAWLPPDASQKSHVRRKISKSCIRRYFLWSCVRRAVWVRLCNSWIPKLRYGYTCRFSLFWKSLTCHLMVLLLLEQSGSDRSLTVSKCVFLTKLGHILCWVWLQTGFKTCQNIQH